jgi:hypothetical protein
MDLAILVLSMMFLSQKTYLGRRGQFPERLFSLTIKGKKIGDGKLIKFLDLVLVDILMYIPICLVLPYFWWKTRG